MIVGWKYRTTFENAHDSFDKIAKFQKEAGADWVITSITTGGDNGSFITAVGFEKGSRGDSKKLTRALAGKLNHVVYYGVVRSWGYTPPTSRH